MFRKCCLNEASRSAGDIDSRDSLLGSSFPPFPCIMVVSSKTELRFREQYYNPRVWTTIQDQSNSRGYQEMLRSLIRLRAVSTLLYLPWIDWNAFSLWSPVSFWQISFRGNHRVGLLGDDCTPGVLPVCRICISALDNIALFFKSGVYDISTHLKGSLAEICYVFLQEMDTGLH
jgi:hypothetical protein